MVKYGYFHLSLIHAKTGSSYKEHQSPGCEEIYAEVEAGDEVYIQVGSDAPEVVSVDLLVDGTIIQQGHPVYPGQTSKVGSLETGRSPEELTVKEVALRFEKLNPCQGADGACKYWIGQVEATFRGNPNCSIPPESTPKPSDGHDTATSAEHDGATVPSSSIAAAPPTVAALDARKVHYTLPPHSFPADHGLASSGATYVLGTTDKNGDKGVKIVEGTTELRTHCLKKKSSDIEPRKQKKRKQGDQSTMTNNLDMPIEKKPEILGTVTLKYCSTPGLIHAGIICKPPGWDLEQHRKKVNLQLKEENKGFLNQIKMKTIELYSDTINSCGEKIVEKREVELFDLTEESDALTRELSNVVNSEASSLEAPMPTVARSLRIEAIRTELKVAIEARAALIKTGIDGIRTSRWDSIIRKLEDDLINLLD